MAGQVSCDAAGHAEFFVWNVVVSIQRRSGRQSALASAAVAQPEHDGSYDEKRCGWDANDEGPGKTGADVPWNNGRFNFGICKRKEFFCCCQNLVP